VFVYSQHSWKGFRMYIHYYFSPHVPISQSMGPHNALQNRLQSVEVYTPKKHVYITSSGCAAALPIAQVSSSHFNGNSIIIRDERLAVDRTLHDMSECSLGQPLSITLSTSSSTLSLSGIPPFTTTITYTNTTYTPICALISLYSGHASRITVRDPIHWKAPNRRIGCFGTLVCDEDPAPEHEDADLVRLSPGGRFENVYTFRVIEGIKYADTHFMKDGGRYWLESEKGKSGGCLRKR
jgi:hypothetical protein